MYIQRYFWFFYLMILRFELQGLMCLQSKSLYHLSHAPSTLIFKETYVCQNCLFFALVSKIPKSWWHNIAKAFISHRLSPISKCLWCAAFPSWHQISDFTEREWAWRLTNQFQSNLSPPVMSHWAALSHIHFLAKGQEIWTPISAKKWGDLVALIEH